MALSRDIQRKLAYGGNATLVTILVIVLVGVLYGVADRNRIRVDLTRDSTNQLQPDTLKKLSLLEADDKAVTVTAFTSQEGRSDSFFKNRELKDFLLELDYQSPVVETRFVDFDRERLTAEQLGVTEYGHMVVQRGEERVDIKSREIFRNKGKGPDRSLEFLGESAFNRAAAQILSTREKSIYVLRGHGEKDVEDPGPSGLSDLKEMLENENYALKTLDFIRGRDMGDVPIVPSDAAAVVVAGPTTVLTQSEEDALVSYIANGGALMVMVDPRSPVPWTLERLGIRVPEGVVADTRVIFPYPDRPVVEYGNHSLNRELRDNRLVTVLSHIAGVRMPEPTPAWMQTSEVLRTSREGWIDRGGELDGAKSVYEPSIDLTGPVVMGWAIELQPVEGSVVNVGKRISRVLVIGDSDLATNQLLAEGPGNATFLVNAFRWLSWDDARLSVIGTPTSVQRLALTEEDQRRIRWLVLGLMPVLTLLVGAGVWTSRRGR